MEERLQLLVATRGQENISFLEKIGAEGECIVANQTDSCNIYEADGRLMISVRDRGVGKNRNLALCLSSADYLLFADDDNVLTEGYPDIVRQSFREHPDADMLIFDADVTGPRAAYKPIRGEHRVRIWNFSRYGCAQIAIKRSSWQKRPVWFSELFGGGARHGSGEDSLFIRDCLRGGYKIIALPQKIVTVNQESSSWFKGYNEKFFYDEGALVARLFPGLKLLAGLYFCIKFSRSSELGFFQCWKKMQDGMKK